MNEAQMIVEAYRRLEPGQRAALATVVSVQGSSYRRPGARMLITENGETTGVLSAGCFEQDVCERAAKVMSNGEPILVKYDTTSDDDIVWGLGLGCSGVIQSWRRSSETKPQINTDETQMRIRHLTPALSPVEAERVRAARGTKT